MNETEREMGRETESLPTVMSSLEDRKRKGQNFTILKFYCSLLFGKAGSYWLTVLPVPGVLEVLDLQERGSRRQGNHKGTSHL